MKKFFNEDNARMNYKDYITLMFIIIIYTITIKKDSNKQIKKDSNKQYLIYLSLLLNLFSFQSINFLNILLTNSSFSTIIYRKNLSSY